MPAKPGGRRMKTITNHVGILIAPQLACMTYIGIKFSPKANFYPQQPGFGSFCVLRNRAEIGATFALLITPRKSEIAGIMDIIKVDHFGPLMFPNICYCNHFSC